MTVRAEADSRDVIAVVPEPPCRTCANGVATAFDPLRDVLLALEQAVYDFSGSQAPAAGMVTTL